MFESIVDPTIGPDSGAGPGPLVLAVRPAELAGRRLGLLANTKRNAAQLLEKVAAALTEKYGTTAVMIRTKASIVDPVPDGILAELCAGCDLVVVGVGDCGSCSASAIADGVLLERAGIPAAVICTDAFSVTADAMAGLRNASGYRYVTTPHPVANLTAEGIEAAAVRAVPELVALLTTPIPAQAR